MDYDLRRCYDNIKCDAAMRLWLDDIRVVYNPKGRIGHISNGWMLGRIRCFYVLRFFSFSISYASKVSPLHTSYSPYYQLDLAWLDHMNS
jgi:hypothetical protein